MDNYNTLFDSDLAEHDYIMSQPIKSPEVCAECEACGKNPDKCNEIKDGWRCPRYERKRYDRS